MELQGAGPLQPSQCFPLHPKRWCFSWLSRKGSSTLFRGGWGSLTLHMLGSIHSASWAFLSVCRWHPGSCPLSRWFTLVRIVGTTQVGLPMWYEAHPGSHSQQEPLYASLLVEPQCQDAGFKDGSWYKREKVTKQASGC